MTKRADLLALAERVEQLTGPDREVDADIACATRCDDSLPHWAKRWEGEWRPTIQGSVVLMESSGSPGPHFISKPYTSSIDAAMTLVPEGWWWRIGNCSVSSDATVGPDVAHCPKELLIRLDEGIDVVIEPPTSAALALTAASLRALAEKEA